MRVEARVIPFYERVLVFSTISGGRLVASAASTPRRQERGKRRIEMVVNVAADVFAEVGYEKATTNAIAARAGMSPGSLYQFFRSKEAIAEALAARYAEQLQDTHNVAFDRNVAGVPFDVVLDQVVDPLVAFNVANPAAHVLLAGSDLSPVLAELTRQLNDTVLTRTEAIIAARAPGLSPKERARVARVTFQMFKGLLPLVLSSRGRERASFLSEMKAALGGYLLPLDASAWKRSRTSGPSTSSQRRRR